MLDSFSTNATVAKIRSIYGSMLTRDDFREMISKRNVAEIVDFLSSTKRFAEPLKDIDPNTVHRGFLESRLMRFSIDTYLRLTSFQGLEDKPFYNYLIKKIECRQLISLVNAVNNGLNDSFVTSLPSYVFKGSKLDLIACARCRSIPEVTNVLKGTAYYKVFKSFELDENGRADLTDAELKLRTKYFSDLLASIKESFFGSEREEITEVVRREVDIINMINAYRMKAYFGYSPEEIKKSSLPFSQLSKRVMDHVYESEDAPAMLTSIRKTVYGKEMTDEQDSIESGMSLRALRYMRHTIARSTSTPVVLYAFMYICETELKNIVRVVEGVRYDVDSAMIEKMLMI